MPILDTIFGSYQDKELKAIGKIKDTVLSLFDKYTRMGNEELQGQTALLTLRLKSGETLDDILPEAFAVCCVASERVLGMTPYPVQIIGGIALHRSNIAEMKTGEGKTLVATLPVYLNALSGKGVHVITVNDYLAKRDSQQMGKLYVFLGLSVGLVTHDMSPIEKKAAYACDITYGTNNEFGFDYLRDNMVSRKEHMMQRGFNFAIIDEVDSILIDEARTPLIISGAGDKSTDIYEQCAVFAKSLLYLRVREQDSKEDFDHIDEDVIIDEKTKTVTLTKNGIKKTEAYFNLDNYSDTENMTMQHHVNQAIRAEGVMKRDIDYVIKDDKVVIVDEFTGRIMDGRRYSQGLHQAIEAKEQVTVQKENKTLATITFQNFFRMYKKLAGMTGTAMSEKDEFLEIYGLSVLAIPTNRPIIRHDLHDAVYTTERAKLSAIVSLVTETHAKGQPVLIGTISIEKSEELSELLKSHSIPHKILNAKNHEHEAKIIAQAGKFGAVTIATNMAGRGTDIILGGNAEFAAKNELRRKEYSEDMIEFATSYFETDNEDILDVRAVYEDILADFRLTTLHEAEQVKAVGGLHIIGTERHESRRIDNQLRGRAGRQGDPGASKFFVSLEDDIMRLFGGSRITDVMNKLGHNGNDPIENKIISMSLESAQKKIEARNFDVRKNVLGYDDVINTQRKIIYKERQQVLDGEDITSSVQEMVFSSIKNNVDRFCGGDNPSDWNLVDLKDFYKGWLLIDEDLSYTASEMNTLTKDAVLNTITNRVISILSAKEQAFTSPIMREVERMSLIKAVDAKWMEHIDAMDELKRGIGLRGYAQHDPIVEYRFEGFNMFDNMVEEINQELTRLLVLSNVSIQTPAP